MPDSDPDVVTLEPVRVALVREAVPLEALRDFYDRAFGAVLAALERQGLAPTGPALGVYFSMPTETVDLGAGFPIDGEIVPGNGVTGVTLPGGPAVQVEHRGSYEDLSATYTRLQQWVHDSGHAMGDLMWETYVTEPTPDADPDEMVTIITWPLA